MEWKQVSIPEKWYDLLKICSQTGLYKSPSDAVLYALRQQRHHFENIAEEWKQAQEIIKERKEIG